MGSLTSLRWQNESVVTHLGPRLLPVTRIQHPDGSEVEVIDVGALFPDQNKMWGRPQSEVTGHAWHHDAIAFSGADANFNGHRTDEELRRLQAIYDYHLQQGWNGIGYHAVGSLERRIYVPRQDVLDVHRAHVAGGPGSGPNWNRQLIGFCHMGNYADRLAPDGSVVLAQADRPPPDAIKAAQAWFVLVTNLIGSPMTLRPHKFYQQKECPGDWTTVGSWDGLVYQPNTAPPEPEPPPVEIAPGVYLGSPQLVPTGKNADGQWGYELRQPFKVQVP
jgi:hypothetical protein